MAIQSARLENKRPLSYHFEERISGRLPTMWETFDLGSLQESLFRPPDGYYQEVFDDRIDGITPQNQHLKSQIKSLRSKYASRGITNDTVFTFQSMGIGKVLNAVGVRELERASIANYWPYDFHPTDTIAVLSFGLCSYDEQLAMVEGEIPGMKPTYGTLVSSCVQTNDCNLVFARRLGNAAGKIGVVGGTLNQNEQSLGDGTYKTPNDAMESEVIEELGITKETFSVQLKAVLSDRTENQQGTFERPVLFFDTHLDLNSRQLKNTFDKDAHAQREHSDLIFINNTQEGILEFMSQVSPEDLHPPAHAVLAVALERAMGVRVI